MPQFSSRLAKVALLAACGAGIAIGCDDSHQADKRVQKTIEESRLARLQPDGADKAQQLLNKAAADSDASPATRAHVKSLLGHAMVDAANERISNPDDGIDAGNREIGRLMWEIGQLGQQIQTSNNLVGSYAQFEPKEAKDKAAADAAAVTGAPDKPIWVGENGAAIPTIAAAQQKVADLQDQIAKQQQAIDTLQAQKKQASEQASQLQQQSETQKGQESVDTFTKASGLRKQATDTQTAADVETNKLTRLQQDLLLAQAQQESVAAAKDQFDKFAQQLDANWKGIQEQVGKQRAQETGLLSGSGPATINAKAAKLGAQVEKTNAAYTQAEENLNNAIKNFQDAFRAATELSTSLRQSMATLPADNQMKKAMDQLVQVYNPNVFKLSEANATLALADLESSKVQTLAERLHLTQQLQAILKNAGLSLPKELDDAKTADELKSTTASAMEHYKATQTLYEDVAEAGGTSDADRNAGHAGRRSTPLYGQRPLLARATGDQRSAGELLTQAKTQRDAISQEGKGAMIALPSELVAIAARPTNAPPAGAATAPAAPATALAAPATQ